MHLSLSYKTYEVLKEQTNNPRINWAYLPYSMHMAGPRGTYAVRTLQCTAWNDVWCALIDEDYDVWNIAHYVLVYDVILCGVAWLMHIVNRYIFWLHCKFSRIQFLTSLILTYSHLILLLYMTSFDFTLFPHMSSSFTSSRNVFLFCFSI